MTVDTQSSHTSIINPLIDQYRNRPGALLPLLHAIQTSVGFIPSESIAWIANGLNLSRAEVHGVLTYYHDFRTQPGGKHQLQICQAEACQACGSDELVSMAERRLQCAQHETSADGQVSLEPVYCLGLCASAPAVRVDDQVYARMTDQKLNSLLDELGHNA